MVTKQRFGQLMNNAVKKYSAVVDLWFLNSVFGVIIVCNLI